MKNRSASRSRTSLRRLLIAFALAAAVGLGAVAPAAAQDGDEAAAGTATVAEVDGLLDPVLAQFVLDQIEAANERDDVLLVLNVNSAAAVVDDETIGELAEAIATSEVPIGVWVGPSGARATGRVAQIIGVADQVGVAPGARVGDTGEQVLDSEVFGIVWGDQAALLRNDTLNWEQVIDLGVVDCEQVDVDELGRVVSEDEQRLRCAAPTVGDFLVQLEDLGFESELVTTDDEIRREPITRVQFVGLSLVDQLFHTVASPPVAYLLFITGMALLVFEFYTGGVGVAGVVGALSFVLGAYGLAVLPTNTWAIALLVVGVLGYAIDVQAGIARFWSVVGTAAFAVGTLALYQDPASMSWIPIVVGIGGMLLAMIGGMPSMVRTRFSTPTIGREWMIGEMGTAVESVDPEGIVRVREALWRARTNRATPIPLGEPIRVVAIEGLVLEVEPEEGGARDYREMRNRRRE